ncbi:Cystathionine beta-lyase family protein involved in aluminum resistance [Halobacillus dabanensis]|uniref:Cystathionine beta-lyase family protein involved in aluminum resistance n=1 Tax=Halobacillus dabanensis TaxID=240302 RepID=A0A1I3YAT1_HALDA|nr:methionine gamma-lyase family protein [Halobacillus dabanensis]SFK28860.1 Cystathionine beta-lyase family protein involved in aluminum resistance [Halobacillus dabanensis]
MNIQELKRTVEQQIEGQHNKINQTVEANQEKVLHAFQKLRVSDSHFNPTTGYGYDDFGRDTLEELYATIFSAEDALVRPQLISGTHAITTSLFGVLRPGDELLYISGEPYDTLKEVIGTGVGEDTGSLSDFGVSYKSVPLDSDGAFSKDQIQASITEKTKVVAIQRSKGYDNRPSFLIKELKSIIEFVRQQKKDVIIFVDNCYGEFVETEEPLEVGADLIAGSLIKNPGGGIVRMGGYIAGRKKLIEMCSYRLTAPGLGKETGASLNSLQEMYQGIFLAPHVVGEALKGAVFSAKLLTELGFDTNPSYDARRTDLIQSVNFNTAEQMVKFCQAIQQASPINSHVRPEPSAMPGYTDEVIMAAGTFIQGASLELTADGPIRPPYTAYVQGGLTYAHVKLAVLQAVEQLLKEEMLTPTAD